MRIGRLPARSPDCATGAGGIQSSLSRCPSGSRYTSNLPPLLSHNGQPDLLEVKPGCVSFQSWKVRIGIWRFEERPGLGGGDPARTVLSSGA